MTDGGTSESGSDRLYVFCHRCNERLGVALSDPEAREIAEGHRHGDVSWSDEPARQLHTDSSQGADP